MKNRILLVLAVVVACVYAKCQKFVVEVNDSISLQLALGEQRPGAIITLLPGTYVGPFAMKASGEEDCPITVTSKQPDTVTLIAGDKSLVINFDAVSYVTFKDIEIANAPYYGMMMMGATNVVVENVNFHDCTYAAVFMSDASDNTFTNCRFSKIGDSSEPGDFGYCFWMGNGNYESANNTVQKCSFGDYLQGIAVFMDSFAHGNTITQNVLRGSHCGGSYWVGINGYENTVSDNSFENVDNTKLLAGIYTHGSRNTYQGNVFDLNVNKYCILEQGGTGERVCASNKYTHAVDLTNGSVDQSC